MTIWYSDLLKWAVTSKVRHGMTVCEAEECYGIDARVLERWLSEPEERM
jgi:hypothetical protein